MPALFIQVARIYMAARAIEGPKQTLFPVLRIPVGLRSLAGVPLLQITNALELGVLLRAAQRPLLTEAARRSG